MTEMPNVLWLEEISKDEILSLLSSKGYLGEITCEGVTVPKAPGEFTPKKCWSFRIDEDTEKENPKKFMHRDFLDYIFFIFVIITAYLLEQQVLSIHSLILAAFILYLIKDRSKKPPFSLPLSDLFNHRTHKATHIS